MKEDVDLLVTGASELVTLAGGPPGPRTGAAMDEIGVVERGAVAVRDGRVVAVGEAAAIARAYAAPRELDARGGTVIPGFVDVHTHPVFDATREREFDMRARGASYQEITAAGGGIFSSVRSLRAASREVLADKLRRRLDRFLRCGTTSLEAKSGYGLDLETEVLALELIAEVGTRHALDVEGTCLAAHQVPPEFADDRPGYVALVTDTILPEVARRGLARSADVFCDQGAYTVDEARAVLTAARDLGFALRVHADELAPVGAAGLAAELGAQTADHLVLVSEEDVRRMAEAGTAPVLLPGTTFSLRLSRAAPARALIEAGLPVVLATDFNAGTCHIPSMVEVVALACYLFDMTVAECLTASTRNAAATLGLPGTRGQLSEGAVADLVVLDVPNHLFLGYQAGWNPVQAVVKDGRVVLDLAS